MHWLGTQSSSNKKKNYTIIHQLKWRSFYLELLTKSIKAMLSLLKITRSSCDFTDRLNSFWRRLVMHKTFQVNIDHSSMNSLNLFLIHIISCKFTCSASCVLDSIIWMRFTRPSISPNSLQIICFTYQIIWGFSKTFSNCIFIIPLPFSPPRCV
jgi:hypothetical protein